jgi:hypothetical protein
LTRAAGPPLRTPSKIEPDVMVGGGGEGSQLRLHPLVPFGGSQPLLHGIFAHKAVRRAAAASKI